MSKKTVVKTGGAVGDLESVVRELRSAGVSAGRLAAREHRNHLCEWGDDIHRALGAVKELIKAVRAGREVQTHNGSVLKYDEVQSEHLAAALARVGGGA